MTVIERRECKGCGALFSELHSVECPIGRPNGRVLLPQSHTVEYVPAEQLQGAVKTRDDLEALVVAFCAAVGEPIPVDAIERARQLRIKANGGQ